MIKQGVSFYSYQVAYRENRLDMEGMVKEVADLGCDGIELVPIMTPPTSYPVAKEEEIDAWHALMDKYHVRPVCLDSIIMVKEMPNRPARPMPYAHPGAGFEEQLQLMTDELKLCHQLGFYIMRIPTGYGVGMDVIEKVLPYAEELGITLGLEIHVPMTIKGPEVQNYIEFIERTGTKNACLIPDMAIFATSLPANLVRKTIKGGADPDEVKAVVKAYEDGKDMHAVEEDLKARNISGIDELVAFAIRNVPSGVDDLKGVIKYIKHFHAKFYEVDENLVEHGIRFDKVVPLLKELGYDGYLNSEYEGQRMYSEDEKLDEVEQVRRQHRMIDSLLQ